jgi:hypothetical protein
MSKRKTEKLFEEIRRLANCFSEGEENLATEELRKRLLESGLDPDTLKARFHIEAKQIAQREVRANRSVPKLLRRAIDSTRPGTDIPRDSILARKAVDNWLESFLGPFKAPQDLEACRAYRKTGEVSEAELEDLDRLEDELKRKVKEESERNS